ncbi:IPT/TIG domain-containing protein [Actinoplanes sp. NPDC020271]|uniref:IPT/TIG domain-containing protein n=1 Tax=Actinoplanes sp. NPDC020271 TaxID=3363896 RepID=UPI00379B0B78
MPTVHRTSRRLAGVALAALLVTPIWPGRPAAAAPDAPPRVAAAAPAAADYAYDGAGQLRGVSTPEGTAQYDYDDSGNPTSVTRLAAGAVAVSSIAPSRAAAGAAVTVSGAGFATTVAGNTVRFNGVTATVTSASAARLVVTVPSGVTAGPVTVTTSGGTATSRQSFTPIAAAPVPVITSFSPALGAAGTSVTITGTGFSATAAADNVAFGATRARVTAATTTSLTVTVPQAAGSGRITVGTTGGIATSATDFVAVPKPFATTDVSTSGTLTVDGTATTVTFGTAGKAAVLRFTGTKGQRLSFGVTGSTVGDLNIYGYTPSGAAFARNLFEAPWTQTSLAGGLALPPLPTSGVYQIALKPVTASATGSAVATLSTRTVSALNLTGSGTTASFARAGQQVDLTFAATAGQQMGIGLTGSTLSSTSLTAQILDANGSALLWNDANGNQFKRTLVGLSGYDLDFVAPTTGTYTLTLGSSDAATGSVLVTASAAQNLGTLTPGTAKVASVTRPGQDLLATFSGTAGQLLSLDFESATSTYLPDVFLVGPDGAVLSESSASSGRADLPALPATGTYTLRINLYSGTGSFGLKLWQRTSSGALSLTGAGTSVSFTSAATLADLSFTATAGGVYTFALSNWTLPATGSVRARILDASGAVVQDYTIGSLGTVNLAAATSGTFHLLLAPTGGATGGLLVTWSQRILGGSLTQGSTSAISVTRPGQMTLFTYAGTAGQRLALMADTYTFAHAVTAVVYNPDGTVLYNGLLRGRLFDLAALPATGSYQILLEPSAETGTLTFTPVIAVNGGTLAVGGTAPTYTVPAGGRYLDATFTVGAGQRISLGFTGWTFASSTLLVRITDSSGTALYESTLTKTGSLDYPDLAAGTYRVDLVATDRGAGAVVVTASAQVNGGSFTLGAAKTITASRIGQSTYAVYAGTSGQLLALAYTNVTMTYYPSVVVRDATGTVIAALAGAATVNLPALPATGTYTITISPYSASGSATATLKTRTAPAAGSASTLSAQVRLSTPPAGPVARKNTAWHRTPQKLSSAEPRTATGAQPRPKPGAGESWAPDAATLAGRGWTTGRTTVLADNTPRQGPGGATALSGRILTLEDKPLPGVTVSVDAVAVTSDADGRFLLTGLTPGHRVLRVDGSTAGSPGRAFGLHDIGVDVKAGVTTVLPYTIWLTRLDTTHTVTFASPAKAEVRITTPAIPGLEVRLPSGSVVRDVHGKVVTQLGITAIPVDRTPFPLPRSQVPSYFTVQPGSSYVFPAGARVIYPNFTHAKPGASMDFWHYDPAGKGWYVYGKGRVTSDGKRVEPAKGTEVYQFTGAMLITPSADPPPSSAPAAGGGDYDGDPVDLNTGLIVDRHTDLTVDDLIPISVTRTYQQSDVGRRTFGIGVNFDYSLDLYRSANNYLECWLLLPDGGRIHYHRTSPGGTGASDYLNAVFAADPTPTEYNASSLAWNGDGWDLTLRSGLTYIFGTEAPLQGIRDKFGNTVTITRDPAPAAADGNVHAEGPITQITSPSGKWIRFEHDSANRITRAEDVLGRAVTYTYTTDGHLWTVTDPAQGVTTYTYESGRLKTIKDPRGTVFLTNTYDSAGRVRTQTLPDNATYQFTYGSGFTDLTDPRGHVRHVTFNNAGFKTSETAAYGTTSAVTTTFARDPASNRITAVTDPLNRRTEYGYDTLGNLASVTALAGTGRARTTTYTYGGPFSQLSRVTDPLNHSTDYGYQSDGALHTVTDPMSRVTTFTTNEAGQVGKVTDNQNKTTTLTYGLGDLTAVSDPLGRITRSFTGADGRKQVSADPQGNTVIVGYDTAGRIATTSDGTGRMTAFEYDPNGNLYKVTDPRSHTTVYAWDTSDRLQTVTDPLNRATAYTYDANGNLKTETKPSGKQTVYDYDDLDRLATARYGVSGSTQESTTTYQYDAGDRVRTVNDSAGGAITITPDDFDRPQTVAGAQGQVAYTYDAAGRRATMTASGQGQTVYGYNNADQLTSVTRGSDAVSIGYDTLGRRQTLTLPAGITQTYGYDDAGGLTSIGYARGTTTLGAITYQLDALGRRVHVDGSYGRVALPAASAATTYDAGDQRAGVTYDGDGNVTRDSAGAYTWNARGQLTAAGATTYGYDALGRQATRTAAGTTTSYLYDGLNAVQETVGTSTTNLLTGDVDEVFARNARSLLTDALGSTIASADTSVAAEYTYDPFGGTTLTGDDQGNRTRFAGRSDEGGGVYQYRNRFYSATAQQFLSRDPLGLASGDANPYRYVGNQPTTLTDPLGTKPQGTGGLPNRVFPIVEPDPQSTMPASEWITSAAGATAGERHFFVVMQGGQVRAIAGSRFDTEFQQVDPVHGRLWPGHTSLAERQSVWMAGTFELDGNGVLVEITNHSGHYKPNDSLPGFRPIEDVARDALGRAGFPGADTAGWDAW